MTAINRYIITGGPGSGKSSLINALKKNGYSCFEEISRVVIKEQHQINGDKLPWKNLADFAEVCYERMCLQLNECHSQNYCFYDRGLPDIIAYMKRGGLIPPKKYFSKCNLYNNTVFIAPPWLEIFVNDAERPETYQDSEEIYHFLKLTYTDLGFKTIELPKVSVNSRVDFIKSYLSSCND
jgi:predicted ATPase